MVIKIVILGRLRSKDNEKCFNAGYRRRPFYKSSATRKWEADTKSQARLQYQGPVLTGLVAVQIEYFFPNNVRPDLLNCPKSLCDALKGVLWADDKQIVQAYQEIKTPSKLNPRTELYVREL